MATRTVPRAVLVVEDDAAIRAAVDALLTDDGYVVLTVATGGEALSVLRVIRPDLVLLDVRLPDNGGAQVLDRLAAIDRGIPVLTMSASIPPVDLSGHYPVCGHLAKPFDIDDLLRLVHRSAAGAAPSPAMPRMAVCR
jgi:CheY-like chemotaxis protein